MLLYFLVYAQFSLHTRLDLYLLTLFSIILVHEEVWFPLVFTSIS